MLELISLSAVRTTKTVLYKWESTWKGLEKLQLCEWNKFLFFTTATGEQNRVWIRSDCVLIMFNFRWPVVAPWHRMLVTTLQYRLQYSRRMFRANRSVGGRMSLCVYVLTNYIPIFPVFFLSLSLSIQCVGNVLKAPSGFHSITKQFVLTPFEQCRNQ